MDITVLTAITGNVDKLQPTAGGAKYVAYMNPFEDWEMRKAMGTDRFSSRVYKILAHKFVQSEYIVWLDGQLRLKVEPSELVKFCKGEAAFFTHPRREVDPFTVFDEMDTCLEKGLVDPILIAEQRVAYKDVPKTHIYYGGAFIRRTTPQANALFEEWWAEYCRYPTRDQLSLFKVFHGKVDVIQEKVADNPYIHYVGHKT